MKYITPPAAPAPEEVLRRLKIAAKNANIHFEGEGLKDIRPVDLYLIASEAVGGSFAAIHHQGIYDPHTGGNAFDLEPVLWTLRLLPDPAKDVAIQRVALGFLSGMCLLQSKAIQNPTLNEAARKISTMAKEWVPELWRYMPTAIAITFFSDPQEIYPRMETFGRLLIFCDKTNTPLLNIMTPLIPCITGVLAAPAGEGASLKPKNEQLIKTLCEIYGRTPGQTPVQPVPQP